jgi:Leucine-rich repeat (LRR) protein
MKYNAFCPRSVNLSISKNSIVRETVDEHVELSTNEHIDSRVDIADIPDNIRHCRSLDKLDFSGNPLANKYVHSVRHAFSARCATVDVVARSLFSSLPSGIIHLRQLTQLILNDVSLAELPRDIGR